MASGAREDDQSLGGAGHRDVAVDSSFDARAERFRVEQNDQVELETLGELWRQRSDPGPLRERAFLDAAGADDTGDPVSVRGEPVPKDRR